MLKVVEEVLDDALRGLADAGCSARGEISVDGLAVAFALYTGDCLILRALVFPRAEGLACVENTDVHSRAETEAAVLEALAGSCLASRLYVTGHGKEDKT